MHGLKGNRPTRAEIDLEALAANYRAVRSIVGEGVGVTCVVKADAYGHGAAACSLRLEGEGAERFAVASIAEGIELREAGLKGEIVILGGLFPGDEKLALEHGLTPVAVTLDQARLMSDAASNANALAKICVKIDTGMNRAGFRYDELDRVAPALAALPNTEIAGILSHFASADEAYEGDFTSQQADRFAAALAVLDQYGVRGGTIDLANSPGTLLHPETRLRSVRIGGLLFGIGRDIIPVDYEGIGVRPVMSLVSEIADLKTVHPGESVGYGRSFVAERESRIALIPIGYHDGLPRAVAEAGEVLINGRRVPIAGRISMDWLTVDVTEIDDASIGGRVTLVGTDGGECIAIEDLANLSRTISYEITCGISGRVRRVYS